MFSYVYMKILESQPRRYDRGISWLSLGHAERIKKRLIDDNVKPGCYALEIGAGTGSLAVLAAKQGARVLGFDISRPMLRVARRKINQAGLSDKIDLMEMGVSGMDRFPDESFDLVMSTLVFSELSSDELDYALYHARRILKSGGRLAVADEARPGSVFKRFLHATIRVPLVIVTFALTQTSTKATVGLKEKIVDAGFGIEKIEKSSFDSFLYVVAIKENTK